MKNNLSLQILVVSPPSLKKAVATLPMIAAIRRKYPDALIAWAATSPSDQLASLCKNIDETLGVPRRWMQTPSCWPALVRKLREPAFDVVIDPYGTRSAASLARLSGAKTRIGPRNSQASKLSKVLNNCLVQTRATHVTHRSLELLSAIGIRKPVAHYRLSVCSRSMKGVHRFLTNRNIVSPWAIISPGASGSSRRWENIRFAEVADYLHQRYAMKTIVTWHGSEEKREAERMVRHRPRAMFLAKQTSLPELVAMITQSSLFIGCDAGPLHLAAILGAPSIGLYGPTRLPVEAAFGSKHLPIQKWYQPETGLRRRGMVNEAMRSITTGDVIRACDRMVDEHRILHERVA